MFQDVYDSWSWAVKTLPLKSVAQLKPMTHTILIAKFVQTQSQ